MRIMRIHADVSANVALDSAMAESFAFLCAVQEQRGLTPSYFFGKKTFYCISPPGEENESLKVLSNGLQCYQVETAFTYIFMRICF